MDRGLYKAVVGDIDGLFKESAVDSIITPEVLLDVRSNVQGSAKTTEILLTPNIVLHEAPPHTSTNEFVEQFNERFEHQRVGSVLHILVTQEAAVTIREYVRQHTEYAGSLNFGLDDDNAPGRKLKVTD